MATLYEYYNTGDDNQQVATNTIWTGQTFTPSTSHTVNLVKLKLYKESTLTGTAKVSIRATDAGSLPTGEDLCSGSINVTTITNTSPGDWYSFDLGAGTPLTATTKYAICLRSPDDNDGLYWRMDLTGDYSGGCWVRSADSGVTWADNVDRDFMFEDWEDLPVGGYPPTLLTLGVG